VFETEISAMYMFCGINHVLETETNSILNAKILAVIATMRNQSAVKFIDKVMYKITF
jgi:hypothetical protein